MREIVRSIFELFPPVAAGVYCGFLWFNGIEAPVIGLVVFSVILIGGRQAKQLWY